MAHLHIQGDVVEYLSPTEMRSNTTVRLTSKCRSCSVRYFIYRLRNFDSWTRITCLRACRSAELLQVVRQTPQLDWQPKKTATVSALHMAPIMICTGPPGRCRTHQGEAQAVEYRNLLPDLSYSINRGSTLFPTTSQRRHHRSSQHILS